MNYNEKPTMQQEQAAVEVKTAFAEHLSQFKMSCDAVQDIERNLPAIANEAFKSALLSRDQNKIIQTDDGTEWQHDLDLSKISSVCHRRVAGEIEFAIVETLPLKSGKEMKEVLNSGHNVREVLKTFTSDQRQVLRLWKGDVKALIDEHLTEKYPGQDMNIVADSFEYKMANAISQTYDQAHSQSHGMRV
ncbi:MAG TPA: hypothetical protein VMA35_05965 [Candidatus Sulfopaludibacter sp.]|nr:hypothetical protein [Candidatus Sulfopaludibacter sp.]